MWGLAAVLFTRTAVTALSRRLKRQGLFNQRAAIFGAGPQGAKLGRYIAGNDGLIISVIGYYDERRGERAPTETDGIAVRGRMADLINRQSVVEGKGSVERIVLGGRRVNKKK